MEKPWYIFRNTRTPHDGIKYLPDPPHWRAFGQKHDGTDNAPELPDTLEAGDVRGATFWASEAECDLINTALLLRRPLLITGLPGSGKSSLAYAVAHELQLGPVLAWPITSRSTLKEGLYSYDAISHLQMVNATRKADSEQPIDPSLIGSFIQLGPLGQALLPSRYPRVLLIDEIDKSDIDLPNDLLNIFEEGSFEIPELKRISEIAPEVAVKSYRTQHTVTIREGLVGCYTFPFVIMTSNQERAFPPAFLRRCIRMKADKASVERLNQIVTAHLGIFAVEQATHLVEAFLKEAETKMRSNDQLLNALRLRLLGIPDIDDPESAVSGAVTTPLNSEL